MAAVPLTKLIVVLGILAAPLLVWATLHMLARRFSVDLHPVLPWLKRLQWVAWGTTVGLILVALAPGNNHLFPFACACSSLSPGLSIAERRLKRQFAPDLISTEDSADGWWPSNK
jgi:hypothetical protein